MTNDTQNKKRKLHGTVVSDKMDKTRVIEVERVKRHRKYLKNYTAQKRYKAHDEQNQYHKGDEVVIEESRPMSKEKRWTIIEKTE